MLSGRSTQQRGPRPGHGSLLFTSLPWDSEASCSSGVSSLPVRVPAPPSTCPDVASRKLPKKVSSSAFKDEETGSERPKVCPDVRASEVPTGLRGKN